MDNLTDLQIINLFEAHHPKTRDQIENLLGWKLEFVNRGCSRNAYKINENLLVKVEYTGEGRTEIEINTIRRIQKEDKFNFLRAHVLPLYYANKKTGVILTKYYKEDCANAECSRLSELFRRAGVVDLYFNNFKKDVDGTVVAIDLGYYSESIENQYRMEKRENVQANACG